MATAWDDEDTGQYKMPQEPRPGRPNSDRRGKERKKDTRLTREKFEEYLRLGPNEILIQLTRANGGLSSFLGNGALDPKLIPLATKSFSKACKCELAEEEKNHLLSCILDSQFIDQLILYYFHDTTSELLENTMEVMLSIMRKMPIAGKNKINILLEIIGNRDNLGEESTRKLHDIRSILKTIPDSNEGIRPRRPDNDNDAPPEDFRNLTIIPRECDIDVSKEPFLRKNKTNDRYDNHDHYLDVQFRLLREDLIAPLRESISEFRSHGSNTERSTLRAYLKVRLVRPVCRLNGLGYRISFDTNQMARVNWDTSRRLIHGSLLCLSTDNFQTCVYATVVNREINNIKNGLIDVCFEFSEADDLNNFVDSNQSSTFAMVESPSYFEPYKHVLIAMQRMGENNFSFYRYIVEGATDVYPPAYLRQNVTLSYDLRPLADNDYRFTDKDDDYTFNQKLDGLQAINVLDDAAWPTADELNLDQSQSVAFRNALCREFAIIQGPPGTGKTHLGLNILKILLHNRNIWQTGENQTPIVVICYTNHALDQFLCGALDFFDGKMVRVGSRSKNEKIKEFSITNHRIRSRQLRQVSQAVHVSRYNMKIELDDLKKEIELNAVQLEIAQREIIQESCFKDESIIEDMHFQQLKSRNGLLHWLGIQSNLENIHDIPPQAQHRQEQDQFEDSDSDEEGDDADELLMFDLEDVRLLDDDDDIVRFDDEVESIKSSITALNVSQLDNLIIEKDDKGGKRKRTRLRYLKQNIRKKISSAEMMTNDEVNGVADLRKLKYPDRWRLYRYWIRKFVKVVMEKLKDKKLEYEKLARRYNEIILIEDRDIMQDATIVGLTTTGAARYQSVLADIGPKIVIFEEAAEVLEGHIVVNLCKKCEHAIFIGDHKQLRPNPTVHKLAKEFNLEISLFERLIGNDIPYDTLKLQHRMRPEISTIIHSIYPDLKDHAVVKNYDDILGVQRNIYFISHCQPDEVNCETSTRVNQFEGKYLKALCKYLMKQGYRSQRITILATYSGQQHYLSSIMKKEQYRNVRIATVDSYQGQENDIILLSLVRSSQEDGIGFLSQNNRLCVAFSRAKMGFYVIGNFEYLQKHSPLIKEMAGKAHRNKIIDEGLPLSCPSHGFLINATQPEHFKISIGGCMKPCNTRLKCGHQCSRVCHVDDRNHQDFKCYNKCVRQCDNGHPCQKLCCEICGPCMIPMPKTIPRCEHEVDVPCSEEPWKAKCTAPMTKILPCGHKGKGICSPLLETKCMEIVEVDRESCGHKINIPCHEKDSSKCNHLCGETLKCGHDCKGTCGDCYKGKLHVSCQEQCRRPLICGHICLDACSDCPPCYQSCINKCKHNECTNKCGEPCIPCNEGCKWRCRHHVCTKRCSELCDRVRCDEPCKKLMACGHQCIGLCGEFCGEPGQQKCRVCDRDELEELHIWGDEDVNVARYIYLEDCCHIFEVNGLDKLMETDQTEDSEIGIKRCPMCKTMIIKTSRYGNIAKKALQHVHNIKIKIVGASGRIADLKKKIEEKRRISDELRSFIGRIYSDDEIEAENKLRAVVSQISIYENIASRCRQLDNTRRQLRLDEDYFKTVLVFVNQMKDWVSIKRILFSEQEAHDAKVGLKKLKNWVVLSIGRARASDKIDEIPARFMGRLASAIRELESDQTIPDDDMTVMIETIEQYIPRSTLGITDQERLNIVAAIGGRKGQWYQCRNGHYYSIGDCGRPDGTAKCPECHEIIGGENHTLHAGNIEAPEMDDAQGPLHTEESDYLYALQLQFE